MLSGVIVMGFFGYITYQYLFLPYFGLNWTSPSPTLWASLTLVLGIWIVGAIAYPVAKWYFKKQGLDFRLVFKEIPPE
jgi:H+/Cl- antiporter ClcA